MWSWKCAPPELWLARSLLACGVFVGDLVTRCYVWFVSTKLMVKLVGVGPLGADLNIRGISAFLMGLA